MASEIRVNKIENRSGLGTVTFADTGVDLAGIVTATTFSGSGASLTALPSAQLSGALPAVSAAALTNVPAANITGTLPAISGASLTNIPTVEDVNNLINNVAMLGFKVATNGSLTKYNLVDQVVDEFEDATGIDASASTNEFTEGGYYRGGAVGSATTTTQTYTYTGSDVTISVASGNQVTGTVKLWGAAGGQDSSPTNIYGGGGAFASGVLSYVSSDGADLIISVGQGGIAGQESGSGGNGGGYSGIFFTSKTHSNALMIAGAGGGASDKNDTGGGAGGAFGEIAQDGQGNGSFGGKGGTQSAGGAAGGSGGSHPATAGSPLTGGHGGGQEARQQSAGYNGGGIQGEEPGGYQGGGGGGGGYYGGGGGNGGPSSDTSGGGGGSSYYNTGSFWSGTPTSTAGSSNTSGGASDSNYPGSGVGSGTSGSSSPGAAGGGGAAYVDITVQTIVYGDLTLQSVDATAQSAPSTSDLVMLVEDGAGTATLNTDIKAFISRDSGANFTQGTLVDEGTWGSSAKRIVAFHNLDISSQPSGTSVCYKITTHNQSASKETRVHAVSHGWK